MKLSLIQMILIIWMTMLHSTWMTARKTNHCWNSVRKGNFERSERSLTALTALKKKKILSSLERERERKVRQLHCWHEGMKHWKNGSRSSTKDRTCKMHWALTKLCSEGWNSLDFVLKSYSYSPPRTQLSAESVFRRTENNVEHFGTDFKRASKHRDFPYNLIQTGSNWLQTVFCSKLISPGKIQLALPR